MSITWYKLKIKKQNNEYECYIRFKFDFQMQSIRIKAFLYSTDSEGNITLTEKKNKLGYDPRIVGNLTIEKNFLKRKRRNVSNNKEIYFEVMKYQGNFNTCNLPLIDDYFRNEKPLIYQYEDLINLMNTKKYKIQISPKKFTFILDVLNYGNVYLNLFNKIEEVEKQELIFLEQNEDALCHRYCTNKSKGSLNKHDDDIEIIEENKIFNRLGGRIFIGSEDKENKKIDENEEKLDDYLYENDYEENSDNSSVYDSNFFIENESNEKLKINKNQLNYNKNNNINIKNINENRSNNINNNDNNDYNNFFIQLKKEENIKNLNNNDIIKENLNQIEDSDIKVNSNKKELNFFEKAKNIVDKFNSNNQNSPETQETNNSNLSSNNNSLNLLCTRIIAQKNNESLLSNEEDEKLLLFSSGFDSNKYYLNLLYKSTLHGDDKLIFHNKCDHKNNLVLILSTLDNKKFGFYTSVGISTDKKMVYDNNAFLFKLVNGEIDCYHIKKNEIAFHGYDDYVLYVGGEQLIIKDNFHGCASSCGLKMKNYKINSNYRINDGNKNFIVKELEAYNIIEI